MTLTSIPSRALAVELPGAGMPLRIVERPVASPRPGEALVEIEACGVCGSDVFLQKGGFGVDKFPVVPGHEAAGRVRAVGRPADEGLVGKQVALYYINGPVDSVYTTRGRENIGPGIERMGVDVDGAFAEYIVRPVHTLIPVEPEMDPAVVAVATDALATPFHALTLVAGLTFGETLVVIGVGGIGSNAVQIGHLLGARVIAVGRGQAKLEQARLLGADETLASSQGVAVLREVAGGNIDVVIECSGALDMSRFAIDCAGYGGRVIFVGAAREPFEVSSTELIWRELSLRGSRGFTPQDISDVLAHVRAGRLSTDHLTSRQRPLHEANSALEELKAGSAMRTVLIPGRREANATRPDESETRRDHELAQ